MDRMPMVTSHSKLPDLRKLDWEQASAELERFVLELPEVTVGERFGQLTWSAGKKAFAWMRPFSKADLKRFGDSPVPAGPILALRCEDLCEKEAILSSGLPGFFTIEHFNRYAGYLIELNRARRGDVETAIVDAWLACAPAKLAAAFVAGH